MNQSNAENEKIALLRCYKYFCYSWDPRSALIHSKQMSHCHFTRRSQLFAFDLNRARWIIQTSFFLKYAQSLEDRWNRYFIFFLAVAAFLCRPRVIQDVFIETWAVIGFLLLLLWGELSDESKLNMEFRGWFLGKSNMRDFSGWLLLRFLFCRSTSRGQIRL